jgi:hypothetical protein
MFGPRTYTSQKHDFFNEVTTLMINLASFNAAAESFMSPTKTEIPNVPDHTLRVMGRVAHACFPIHQLMHSVVRNVWPSSVQIEMLPASLQLQSMSNGIQLQSDGIANLVVQLVGSTFLKYYERNAQRIKAGFPNGPKTWPEPWRFAWLLRNAIAHGDSWSINDATFPLTQWHGITVTPADSGQPWFDLKRYLGGGDVLLLMEALDGYGLPP